ncbi:MAG TPA: single-stranded-DNA-specific exonuclease RecJ [Kouleothrix sp.]|uniref:single-stranded-DNA-specific exonuclease RecJ n=1 Tax=Kouleothrix sp. TaxID=2779161 RepID=UPI002BB1F3E2|nr:single-stranded-DNA-specific exonuclease RecJ [Kouleothrix sp.]HRC76561.1 single-stranded-DNA-specific exonuclease RecJ [Kouleothrix sp.]
MSAHKKRWVLRDPAPADFLATMRDRPAVVATLLYQRDLRSQASIASFLSSDYKSGLHDPFLLKGMDAAARRVAAAIAESEPIAVYGDFDTDGVTAVTLLMQAIGAMGGDIRPYIPHRLREGYGLNIEAIDQLAAEGVRVLITVDCGISNLREVAHANAHGIDVIVTDHHTPPDTLPDAYAVVNPKQPGCAYPYKQLVGVGIAYKLVQALARLGVKMPLRGRDLLDVVALGTVTDMGPLNGENRVLVRAGLESINASQRPGLKALVVAAGLVQGKITSTDISFMLGPRLNAAGRLDDAVLAYQLLLADDFSAAQQLAERLNQANRQRQELTKQIQQSARQQATDQSKHENRIIVLDNAEYPAGLVGLVAARLVEELGRPVLMLERGEEVSRGSARSVPGFNIFEALTSCEDLFVRYGGHSAAAGFTIATANLPALEQRLLAYADAHLPDDLLTPALEIDAEVPLGQLSWELLAQIAVLEPFGQANPQPVLLSRHVHVAGAWPRGAEGQHLKLRIDDGAGGPAYEAIAFRLGKLAHYFERHPWLDIAYTLEAHEWNGTRSLQLNVKDLRRAQ